MTTHRKQTLRSVKPTDKPVAKPRSTVKPMTLAEAVESGDYFEIKLAQQRDIVASLPNVQGPAKASLQRQLSLVSAEVESLRERRKQEAAEDLDGGRISDEAWDANAI